VSNPEHLAPRLTGPRVFGVRPRSPVLHTLRAVGAPPRRFHVEGLPSGVLLNPETGLLSGRVSEPGSYWIRVAVSNQAGAEEAEFRVEVGETIALTPPLGWNSWNCWADSVDDAKVRQAAQAMAASGLADHGWTYINIDDGWQGVRGGPHRALQPNEKFPDMKGLADYVHGLGLKLGIYSTPWVRSYAGYAGGAEGGPVGPGTEEARQRGHQQGDTTSAAADAREWAEWGIDYLKYDWAPWDVPAAARMRDALRQCGRDIVYSLSNTAPFEQAAEWARLANCWRTTSDIRDTWRLRDSGFLGVEDIGFSQDRWRPFAGPGHWNDPDMLVVGYVGWGPHLHPTGLTPDEQITHITLWCLLAAPLLLGCDLTRLDDFTLDLLTNDEVLAVHQDPLGRQAAQVVSGPAEVWARPLEDGSLAVGLFNRDDHGSQSVRADWSALGLPSRCAVRDLWRHADCGVHDKGFETPVPPHGAVMVRVSPHSV